MKIMDFFKILGALLLFVAVVGGYFYLKDQFKSNDCEEYYQELLEKYDKDIASKDSIILIYKHNINNANDSILVLNTQIENRNASLDSLKTEYENKIPDISNWNASELSNYFIQRYSPK